MNGPLRQVRDFFVSLTLSVVLLVLGLILVFVATLDQVNLGIWAVQEKYFRSFIIWWRAGNVSLPVFPGGYLVGGLLLLNLVAAHVYRFKFTWRKAGLQLTHAGLILLLLGELFTGLFQDDYSMRLTQGEPRNYSESFRENELAIIDTTDAQYDQVVAIPEAVVARKSAIQHPHLPFRVVVREYAPNSHVSNRPADAKTAPPAPGFATRPTKGIGLNVDLLPLPITYRHDERNLPGAVIELVAGEGSLGTWIVSADPRMPPQRFEHGGRTYTLGLRYARAYKHFTLTLLKFSHDRYSGTEIPKNFSSRIKLNTADGRDDREVLIYMNNPLRYAGFTFYQASFEPGNDKVTILQVVRNPSWLIPYIACSVMSLGLIWQFCLHLFAFIAKRRAAPSAAAANSAFQP
jgi:hypothetical protein